MVSSPSMLCHKPCAYHSIRHAFSPLVSYVISIILYISTTHIQLNDYLLSVQSTALFSCDNSTQSSQRVLNARVGLFDCCALCHNKVKLCKFLNITCCTHNTWNMLLLSLSISSHNSSKISNFVGVLSAYLSTQQLALNIQCSMKNLLRHFEAYRPLRSVYCVFFP